MSRRSLAIAGLCRAVTACAVIASGVFGVKSANAQCMYEIVAEIAPEGCPPFDVAPIGVAAINDHGVVVGSYLGCNIDNLLPYMWSQEMGFTPIPLPPGVPSAEPRDINNHGEIVGRLARPDLGGFRAFHYKEGVWTELPPTGGGFHSEALGVNDEGWVCGYRDTDSGRVAFRWRDEDVEEFQPRNGDSAHANEINENNSVVGQTTGSLQGSQRAFWWVGRTVIVIPPLPGGDTSNANAINDTETIAGTTGIPSKNGPGQRRSWYFREGLQVDLGDLPEADHRTSALDINNAGQIVGRSETDGGGLSVRAFFWQHGQIINLETLVADPPKFLWMGSGNAINSTGLIAASNQAFGGQFILAPVDRPLGDANIDCVVDELDLIAVLGDWGPQGGKENHPTDMVTSATFQPPGDGKVDGADLAVVLGNWSVSGSQSSSRKE